jgi:hypothetical protein
MSVDSSTVQAYHTPHLIRSISPSVRELVAPLFFHYFDVEEATSGHALISCLPQTISETEDDAALSAAISSVGYALLSNFTNSSDNLIMARKNYGIAVRLTSNTLQTSIPTSETCRNIRIILILAIFEVSSRDWMVSKSTI